MIEVILGIYYLNFNPALTPLQKRLFQLAKMPEIRDFKVDFSKNFGGHRPKIPILGMGYGAPPQNPPQGGT